MELLDGPFGCPPLDVGHEGATLRPQQLDRHDLAAPPKKLAQILLGHLGIHVADEGSRVARVKVAGMEQPYNTSTNGSSERD